MDLDNFNFSHENGDAKTSSLQAKTSLRLTYEAEARVIKQRIGTLIDIQSRLDLPARKICQLLMVDPSAWNRWTRGKTPVPPHIYRSLEWYLLLQEKHPGLPHQLFLPVNHKSRTPLTLEESYEIPRKKEGLDKVLIATQMLTLLALIISLLTR